MKQTYKVVVMQSRKNDAREIAEALRVGHFRECVHRSEDAVEIRSLLHLRQTAIEKRTHVINSLRGNLNVYGIKFSKKAGKSFRKITEEPIKNLHPSVQRAVHSLSNIFDLLNKEIKALTYCRGRSFICKR